MVKVHPVQETPKNVHNNRIIRPSSPVRQDQDIEENEDRNIIQETCNTRSKKKVKAFMDHWSIQTFSGILVIYSLFGDDIRQVSVGPDSDQYFYWSTGFVLIFFSIEIILTSYSESDYIFSFFFWLDVISTASLIFDIAPWTNVILDNQDDTYNYGTGQAIRAARTSRIGTRAAKIARIIRLIRLIRIVKLYKAAQKHDIEKALNKKDEANTGEEGQEESAQKSISEIKANDELLEDLYYEKHNHPIFLLNDEDTPIEQDTYTETNVGRILGDRTIKKVIILVLAIMCSVPVFNVNTYWSAYSNYSSGVQNMIWQINHDPLVVPPLMNYDFYTKDNCCSEILNQTWDNYITAHQDTNPILVDIKQAIVNGTKEIVYKSWESSQDYIISFRNYEKEVVTSNEDEILPDLEFFTIATLSIKKDVDLDAYLALGRTLFVCFVLGLSSLLFTQDANRLVLSPIESMLNKVKQIAKNPLSAARIEEEDAVAYEAMQRLDTKIKAEKMEFEKYETSIQEKIIVRIGALLALGFGEAGSEVIAKNMAKSGEVNPMIPGKKIIAIYGFCDIRNFTDVTEVLQEGVMVFVNEIAEILHSCIDFFNGSPNKNIGDAFLIVWRFPPEFVKSDVSKNITLISSKEVSSMTELAIISFIKVQANINKSVKLEKYRTNQGQIQRLKNAEYRVKMGMGLHLGWSIEGAIGSEYKIDPSYLGHHVNMAMKLEAATKQYGVDILISNSVVDFMSELAKNQLRKIDKVYIKGNQGTTMDLYTFDINVKALEIERKKDAENLSGIEKKKQKIMNRNKRDFFRQKVFEGKRTIIDVFKKDKDIRKMREIWEHSDFFFEWKRAYEAYGQGDWETARILLERCEQYTIGYEDKPSRVLINFIDENGREPPENWNGARALDSL